MGADFVRVNLEGQKPLLKSTCSLFVDFSK